MPSITRWRQGGTTEDPIVLDLHSGLSLGPFSLGRPICDAFAQIEQQPDIYDAVHVKYSDEEPLGLDIVISFPNHGFHLRFDPWSQRLRLIEIVDVTRLKLRYATSVIGGRGPSSLATSVTLYDIFGPSYPGIYDEERGLYTLFYPGLSYAFPIPSMFAEWCRNRDEPPLVFPDGSTSVTCRVSIYNCSANANSKVGIGKSMDKARLPPLPAGSLYMEEVLVKLGKELWFTLGGQHIPFGSSPQDVWIELGRPSSIHKKQVDRMVIHTASDLRPQTTLCRDYFYNYFSRGLDILFDGQTHTIKKFVLHTNYPGHEDFNSYERCNFVIYSTEKDESYDPDVESSELVVTPSAKWDQVKGILGDCGQPALQSCGSTRNPFGSTYVYVYPNAAFEVMENGYIATVTLFQS